MATSRPARVSWSSTVRAASPTRKILSPTNTAGAQLGDQRVSPLRGGKPRHQHASEQPKQVTLPGNIGPRGQDPPHHATIQHQGQERDQQGGDATLIPPTCHQVAKVPKEHTAGTNVVRRAPEEPERSTAQEDDPERYGEKDPCAIEGHKAPQRDQRHRIEDEV